MNELTAEENTMSVANPDKVYALCYNGLLIDVYRNKLDAHREAMRLSVQDDHPVDHYEVRGLEPVADSGERLPMVFDRAELGIDGNAGFALLGENLQDGEAEFVTVEMTDDDEFLSHAEMRAAKQALARLRARLGMPNLSYHLGPGLSR